MQLLTLVTISTLATVSGSGRDTRKSIAQVSPSMGLAASPIGGTSYLLAVSMPPSGLTIVADFAVCHVGDGDAAVIAGIRIHLVLEMAGAEADGHQTFRGDIVILDKIALDGIGALLRERLIVGRRTAFVGITGENKGVALQCRIGQGLAKFVDLPKRRFADIGRVVFEINIQIDGRLVLGDGRDLFALAAR